MSKLFVDEIVHQSSQGSGTITLGASGETIALASGAEVSGFTGQNYPAFKAVLSANQSISGSTSTVLQINTELYDIGGYFDTSTYRYTPPAGKYCFVCSVGNNSYETFLYAFVLKNGSRAAETLLDATQSVRALVSCVLDANGTDYFELGTYISGGSAILDDNNRTWFSAFRIGA